MRRKLGERRLIDVFTDVEKRREARRKLLESRREEEDRREVVVHVELERRKSPRRVEDIEKLQRNNPEYNLPLEP